MIGKTSKIASDVRYIDVVEACDRLGLSRSSFYRAVKAGRLPRPVKLNKSNARWRLDRLISAFEKGAP
jgi:predicted DNA-binding transcriptional regulator AlpA